MQSLTNATFYSVQCCLLYSCPGGLRGSERASVHTMVALSIYQTHVVAMRWDSDAKR